MEWILDNPCCIAHPAMKPVIALSLGDPAGIGPEVLALALPHALELCRPVVFGHWPSLRAALERHGVDVALDVMQKPQAPSGHRVVVVPCGSQHTSIDEPGTAAAWSQFTALEAAVDAVLDGLSTALVTAPVSKAAISSISPGFLGHTEYLARRAGLRDDEVTMVFWSERLSVGLVTTHVPLSMVAAEVTQTRFERTVRHVHAAASRFVDERQPRIVVAGLNPHAGESGLIGLEEIDVMAPIITALRREGIDVTGPLPAEAVFRDALAGKYDAVVSAYHDQALVALKLLGVGASVNVTVGLPFVRTSPDHGVAYDIARQGLADPAGMMRAIELAVKWISPGT